MPNQLTLAGVLLACSVVTSLAAGFADLSPILPGVLQLASGVLLWRLVPASVRGQSLFLVLAGCSCLWLSPHAVPLAVTLSKNQQMIAMFAGIGLLRRIPVPREDKDLPRGSKALWQTVFGIHWMGSAINISAMAIFADRLADRDGHLAPFPSVMLARGMAMAALWSPFFVAMAVVLTNAPGADYRQLLIWGLPLSQILLAGMIWQTSRSHPAESAGFQGYPFRAAALATPMALAATVLVGHALVPEISILTLITLVAPGYALLANWRNQPIRILAEYIGHDLPRLGPEIVLFVAAGILGAGLSALAAGQTISLTGSYNQLFLVMAGLAAIMAASSVGIHPVVGITVVAGILATADLPPNLLAMSFLMSWGLGVLINPISGLHLFLAGRYAFAGRNAWRWNLPFALTGYLVCCVWLYLFSLVSQ